ncbi:MAG: branched-chain amino acid aminotransferase [Chitinophagaceae bacterium]|nr:branched-chain amino acid aminotransferase [Chitinophagaceae bacterium]
MELLTGITVRRSNYSKLPAVDFSSLEFGQHVSDHMLVADYAHGEWQQAQIVPFANLSLSPATLALHYGQTVFEGMKAFCTRDGRINIFRLERHYDRFVRSLDRMCMAVPPKDLFTEGLVKLVQIDKGWVPRKGGASLYLRPFMYASEAKFGVKVSDQYRLIIFSGPVPELYAEPIKVKVETNYTRASKGGTGFAKCGGNYGGAFYPTQEARKQGYDQVLWTTGDDNPFIEESGTMNVMFVINGKLVTPPVSDSILDGVTRDSLLTLAGDLGYPTEERRISVAELELAFHDNSITEAFGAGTAAVVAPIKTICINNTDHQLPKYSHESLWRKLKHKLEQIRTGTEQDVHEWNFMI